MQRISLTVCGKSEALFFVTLFDPSEKALSESVLVAFMARKSRAIIAIVGKRFWFIFHQTS